MTIQLLTGDCRSVLKTLPAESVHCVVTSPPYFNLRDYQVAGQIGLESTPGEYIETLVGVFREVWRVMRPDATLWLNIGDSMAGSGKGRTGWNGIGDQEERQGFHDKYHLGRDNQLRARWPSYAKPKDLLLIPFRLAIALQDDGWYVRSDIAWCKKSCMPESVLDRPTNAWEHVFLLAKQAKYFYDSEAVKEPSIYPDDDRKARSDPTDKRMPTEQIAGIRPGSGVYPTRNMRSYWLLGPEPLREAHFATFVSEIPRRAILAGTSERGCCPTCGAPWVRVVEREVNGNHYETPGDKDGWDARLGHGRLESSGLHGQYLGIQRSTRGWRLSCTHAEPPVPATVLDPFSGAGTTLLVADRLQRNAIGIELSPEYAAMARKRLQGDAPMFVQIAAD